MALDIDPGDLKLVREADGLEIDPTYFRLGDRLWM
jgi:hypothetical protein